MTERCIITVLAPDRPAIITEVTDVLYGLGGNLETLNQSVVRGWLTMTISVAFENGPDIEAIREAVEAAGDFSALVRPLGNPACGVRPSRSQPYVVTVLGEDKPGIVRALTRTFADQGANVEDVWNEVVEGRFTVIFHVAVPPNTDPKALRYALDQTAAEVGVHATLQHQDLFTATNSLTMRTRKEPESAVQ